MLALPFTKFQSKGFRGDRESLLAAHCTRSCPEERGRVILAPCNFTLASVHAFCILGARAEIRQRSRIRVDLAAFTSFGRSTSINPRPNMVISRYLGSKIVMILLELSIRVGNVKMETLGHLLIAYINQLLLSCLHTRFPSVSHARQ